MTAPADPSAAQRLSLLVQEILRWNRQINLVTRVETATRLDRLIGQCLEGWDLVRGLLGDRAWFPSCSYVDIGAGAGLPGLVWAILRESDGHDGPSFLVEPRQKRAWFLRRTARALSLGRVGILARRWEEAPFPEQGEDARSFLVSMKALRLGDLEVLARLGGGAGGSPSSPGAPPEVAIVRFLPPRRDGQGGSPLPPPGGARAPGGDGGASRPPPRYVLRDAETLERADTGLDVRLYVRSPGPGRT